MGIGTKELVAQYISFSAKAFYLLHGYQVFAKNLNTLINLQKQTIKFRL